MATHPKTAQAKHPGKSATKQVLSCSICDFKTKESHYAKQELGRHMKFVHGQAGASSSAKLMQEKKFSTYEGAEQQENPLTNGKPRKERKQYTSNAEIQAAYYAGKIAAYCEAEAEKLGVSKEQFTRKISELFFANQLR